MTDAPINHLHGPPLESLQYVHVFLVPENPELDTTFQVWPHQWWTEGKDPFFWPAGNSFPNVAQDAVCLFCCKGTLLAHVELVYWDPQVFSAELLSSQLIPGLCWCRGLFLPRYRILHFSVELDEITVGSFLQPVEVPLNCSVSNTPLSFTSSAKPLTMDSVPSSRSLMKMLNSTGHTTDCTSLELDFMPLITTLWVWQFSQFSIHHPLI